MHPNFSQVVSAVHSKFEALLAMPPVKYPQLPKLLPKGGIYLFSEGGRHLYVGRSNKLRQRFGQHCKSASQDNQAVFAFKLAREATGNTARSYAAGPKTRRGLLQDQLFAAAFDQAKQRLRDMDIRFVEENDQARQALLEIYCVIALACPYNDLGTS